MTSTFHNHWILKPLALTGCRCESWKCVLDKTGTLIQGRSFHVCVDLPSRWSQHLPALCFLCSFVPCNPRPDKWVADSACTPTVTLHSLSLMHRDHMAERESFHSSRSHHRTRVPYCMELSDSLALLAVYIVLTMFGIICLRKQSKWCICALLLY